MLDKQCKSAQLWVILTRLDIQLCAIASANYSQSDISV